MLKELYTALLSWLSRVDRILVIGRFLVQGFEPISWLSILKRSRPPNSLRAKWSILRSETTEFKLTYYTTFALVINILLVNLAVIFDCLFVYGATAPSGPGSPLSRGFLITHNDAPQSVGLLWASDKLVAETSTWQHTTFITDSHPCHRWDSNPQSQQASGRRLTPKTVRPLGPAYLTVWL